MILTDTIQTIRRCHIQLKILASAARALDLIPGGLLGRMLREDADHNVDVFFPLLLIKTTYHLKRNILLFSSHS